MWTIISYQVIFKNKDKNLEGFIEKVLNIILEVTYGGWI
jgi:hypothetical protein